MGDLDFILQKNTLLPGLHCKCRIRELDKIFNHGARLAIAHAGNTGADDCPPAVGQLTALSEVELNSAGAISYLKLPWGQVLRHLHVPAYLLPKIEKMGERAFDTLTTVSLTQIGLEVSDVLGTWQRCLAFKKKVKHLRVNYLPPVQLVAAWTALTLACG